MTAEQIEQARQMWALDYVLRYESDKFRRVGGTYRSKEHPSLAVNDKGFYWHSTGEKGVIALDYLIKVHGYNFADAVCRLIGESTQQRAPPSKPATPTEPKTLALPRRDRDNYQVIAYLQNRGIDRELIMDCINRGVLYQSAGWHNAVFLGKDESGKTRYAAIRSTNGSYKCDAEGSDKSYAFCIPPQNPNSTAVMLHESPIDTLSHILLCKRGSIPDFDGWRVSLGGTSALPALRFLERHPEIDRCIIATDNDEAGNAFAEKIAGKLGVHTERMMPPSGTDWNDALVSILQAERGSRSHEEPDI